MRIGHGVTVLPRLIVTAILSAAFLLPLGATSALAATGDVGFQGPPTAGAGSSPTGEKPESKLWWNDGRWWADMISGGQYHIWYLDRSASPEEWVDTGTPIDDRSTTKADTLWDGTHLYVASAVFATSSTTESTNQTRLYRFSYNSSTKAYSLDANFPQQINNTSSETITLDRDSTGKLWATWTQSQKVYYNATKLGDTGWGTPAVLPVANATGLSTDDISTLVSFGSGTSARIGVLWSNQTTAKVYFAIHNDSSVRGTWQPSVGVPVGFTGPGQADDHLNIKDLQGDAAGRVYAVIKTSLDDLQGAPGDPQIVLVARDANGTWSNATFGTLADCHTRPVLVLDAANNQVHVYATAPNSGCPYTGYPGNIYEKTTPMDNLSFGAGKGTVVMKDATCLNLNNVTTTKQTVNSVAAGTAGSGIVLLASNDYDNLSCSANKSYWFSDQQNAPAAGIVAAGSTKSSSSTASTAVDLVKPTGTTTGDVLLTTFGVGGAPTVTSTPTGWVRLATLRPGGTSSVFAYYHVVTDADSGVTGYSWTLNSARTYGGVVTRYVGVDPANPLDADAVTAVTPTGTTSTKVTAPGVTTATPNALLVGGVGAAGLLTTVTPPSGWTEAVENGNVRLSEQAYALRPSPGFTGPKTWTFGAPRTGAAWMAALRPA